MADWRTSEEGQGARSSRKRLRTQHACDACRSRKIRCDGNTPCATCLASTQTCEYGSEAGSRGKTDLILDGVLRIEQALQELNATINAPSASRERLSSHLSPAAQGLSGTSAGSPTTITTDTTSTRALCQQVKTPISDNCRDNSGSNSFENAVLDSMHTSTTESVLQWHYFDAISTLRDNYTPLFQLEQSRPALSIKMPTIYPYVSTDEAEAIASSFQKSVNFWYPTMSQSQLRRTQDIINSGVASEDSVEACIALLTMALGCASQVTFGLDTDTKLSDQDQRWRASRRQMGDVYFDAALKKAYTAHLSVSSTSSQCLFYIALYFAFLVRPLQAWEYIRATAAKCMMLLSYPPEGDADEDHERTRRVFWSCYIVESDYIAELSTGPASGIARMESSVPLPSSYDTHMSEEDKEQSSLYLLACISMRRLLNRVHQLLYAEGTGAALDTARFPYIVTELQHQLDNWRDFLPAAFSFILDTSPAANAASGFLRQRYLTCQSVIHRPYLVWLLSGSRSGNDDFSASAPSQSARHNCKACLDACLMHILNLRGFPQTTLVDSWICSLSMACAMLVLVAACHVPSLRSLIGPEVLLAGDHLKQILDKWQHLANEQRSPTVDQSLRIIHETDRIIKQIYVPVPL